MSKNKGTLVSSTIRPISASSSYPTAHANELLGGFQTVNDIILRDNIVTERRAFGMLVYVVVTDEFYQLKTVNSLDLSDNLNWYLEPFGSGITVDSIGTKLSNIPQYATDSDAISGGLTSGYLYSCTSGGNTLLCIVP